MSPYQQNIPFLPGFRFVMFLNERKQYLPSYQANVHRFFKRQNNDLLISYANVDFPSKNFNGKVYEKLSC